MSTTSEPLDYTQAARLADEARRRLSEGADVSDLLDRLVDGLTLSARADDAAVESGGLVGDALDRVFAHQRAKRDAMFRAFEEMTGIRP